MLIDAHGGPASYTLLAFNSHPYWQTLVAEGWTILALNAVGSSSFGRDFSGRLRGRWGELDLPQHLAAAAILRDEGLVNEKWAIAGKSYGGYLAAYAIGHCEQLCAAVISAPVSDLEGHFGTSDSGYYSDPYAFLGDPFEEKEVRDNSSPIKEADRASIPTLILQGEADERCPKNQSEQLFVRLARKPDLPVEMVLYPNGSHHFFERGDPKHRVDAVARLVRWIKDWSTVSQGASVGGQDKEHPHSYDAVKEPAVATS